MGGLNVGKPRTSYLLVSVLALKLLLGVIAFISVCCCCSDASSERFFLPSHRPCFCLSLASQSWSSHLRAISWIPGLVSTTRSLKSGLYYAVYKERGPTVDEFSYDLASEMNEEPNDPQRRVSNRVSESHTCHGQYIWGKGDSNL